MKFADTSNIESYMNELMDEYITTRLEIKTNTGEQEDPDKAYTISIVDEKDNVLLDRNGDVFLMASSCSLVGAINKLNALLR